MSIRIMRLLLGAVCVAFVISTAGCEQEGPAEEAGKEIDQAAEKAGEELEKAGEDIEDAVKDDDDSSG